MASMPPQIKRYEEIGALSAQMVEAARAQDWQRLITLEKRVAELRDALMADDDNDKLTEPERRMKAALIQRILDDDAEIRRHTEPWMEHVREYLESADRRRRIERAYGANTSRFGNPAL